MGANATQGTAVLIFLVAFTLLGLAFYYGANILLILISLAVFGASVSMFLKCKPWENEDR